MLFTQLKKKSLCFICIACFSCHSASLQQLVLIYTLRCVIKLMHNVYGDSREQVSRENVTRRRKSHARYVHTRDLQNTGDCSGNSSRRIPVYSQRHYALRRARYLIVKFPSPVLTVNCSIEGRPCHISPDGFARPPGPLSPDFSRPSLNQFLFAQRDWPLDALFAVIHIQRFIAIA